jgi:hypothetical protein
MQVQSQPKGIVTAYERLASVGGDPLKLNEPFRTVVLADTALGLIGNGGLDYFFESDFPECPDYSVFVAAFQNLGLTYLADGLRELISLFPFQAPHKELELRRTFLESAGPEFLDAVEGLNQQVWQDPSINDRLQSYGAAG